jgi:hypothetical protein
LNRARLARLALLLAAALAAAGARRAAASIEEFASFDVATMEEDDESMLDHYLARPVEPWSGEWERALSGLRADQGCMTSGIWHQQNQFKTRSPMGQKAFLDIGFEQVTDPMASWQWLQFDFRFPTRRFGVPGVRFRPAYDKSQHDFAALWDLGDATTPLQVQLTLTLEDTFNSIWEFRQTRVGNHAEPYRRHPYEPGFRVVARGARHRVELSGRWLTPSRKLIEDPLPGRSGEAALWGSKAFMSAEATRGGWEAMSRFEMEQVLSSGHLGTTPGDGRVYRRLWIAEGAVRRTLAPRWSAELRYAYRDRAQDWRPPAGGDALRALDRMPAAELDWQACPDWRLRFGVLYDRVAVDAGALAPLFTYGSRKESRGFLGVEARFGRVRVQGVEGIELDSEPYPVSFHHDKGFLHLQTTF